MSSVPVIKLGFSSDWKVLTAALKTDPDLEVVDYSTATEVADHLGKVPACLVLSALTQKQDIVEIATLMKFYKKAAPDTAVKIVVINFSGDKVYEKATAKLGIQDLLDPDINTKALKFKIDFWMKGLKVQAKKAEAGIAAKNAIKASEAARNTEKKSAEEASTIKWDTALDCTDDVWLIKNEAHCKRVLGKWLIRLMGPSPYVGQWTEVNGKPNIWKYEIRPEERENFYDGKGNWYFKGDQKPDFVWKENNWLIAGTGFELFYQDAEERLSRLSLKDKILSICKNSTYALTKEQLIIESFDKDIKIKNENNFQTNEEVDTEGGTDKFKNLDGKGKTDKYANGPLSGKTSGGDDLTSGLLALDLDGSGNGAEGPMTGPATGPINKGKELSLENKNHEHKTHYKNHNPAEKIDPAGKPPGYAPEKLREGQELGLENKNQEHKTHYKNHNEAEKFDASDKQLRHAAEKHREGELLELDSKQEKSSGYEGASGTDKLNNYYKNKQLNEKSERESEKEKEQERGKKSSPRLLHDSKEESQDSLNDLDDVFSPRTKPENSANASQPKKSAAKENDLLSLDDARKAKELEKILEDNDPELAQACENASIQSYLTQGSLRVACTLDDYFDQTIIFSTSLGGINEVSEVDLDLSFEYLKEEKNLKLRGSITSIEQDDEGTNYITVEISGNSISEFDSFVKLYQTRQKNIDFFLKTVKGTG